MEKPKKDVILEVGFGKEPVFLSSASSAEIIPNNSLYIGVELNKENIIKAKQEVAKTQAEGKIIPQDQLLLQADGENLPIPDHSVDQIIFRNIFGAPGRFFKHFRYLNPSRLKPEEVGEAINYKPEEFPFPPRNFYGNSEHLKLTLEGALALAKEYEARGTLSEESFFTLEARFNLLESERAEQLAKTHFISEATRVLQENGQLVIVEILTPAWAKNYIEALKENPDFSLEQYSQDPKEIEKYGKQVKPEDSEKTGDPFVAFFRKTAQNQTTPSGAGFKSS